MNRFASKRSVDILPSRRRTTQRFYDIVSGRSHGSFPTKHPTMHHTRPFKPKGVRASPSLPIGTLSDSANYWPFWKLELRLAATLHGKRYPEPMLVFLLTSFLSSPSTVTAPKALPVCFHTWSLRAKPWSSTDTATTPPQFIVNSTSTRLRYPNGTSCTTRLEDINMISTQRSHKYTTVTTFTIWKPFMKMYVSNRAFSTSRFSRVSRRNGNDRAFLEPQKTISTWHGLTTSRPFLQWPTISKSTTHCMRHRCKGLSSQRSHWSSGLSKYASRHLTGLFSTWPVS